MILQVGAPLLIFAFYRNLRKEEAKEFA
jgi:hypothetical protein